MPDFGQLIRESLAEMPEQLQQANADLDDVIANLSNSIRDITDDRGWIVQTRSVEPTPSLCVQVSLAVKLPPTKPARNELIREIPLARIAVPPSGYPLAVLRSPLALEPSEEPSPIGRELQDKEALVGFFEEMGRDRNSPLIQTLRFYRMSNDSG